MVLFPEETRGGSGDVSDDEETAAGVIRLISHSILQSHQNGHKSLFLPLQSHHNTVHIQRKGSLLRSKIGVHRWVRVVGCIWPFDL